MSKRNEKLYEMFEKTMELINDMCPIEKGMKTTCMQCYYITICTKLLNIQDEIIKRITD